MDVYFFAPKNAFQSSSTGLVYLQSHSITPAPSRMTSADDTGRRGRHFKSSESAKLIADPKSHTPVLISD